MKIEQPGPDKFTELSDVPNTYVGSGSDVVKIKVTEDGVEFVPGGGGAGTVTDFVFTNANGISGLVLTSTTTPTLSLSLGAITPTSVVSSGSVSGTNLSGTNTGDQNLFRTIAVSGQSDVVADTTTDTLTLVAGTNVTITTNAATDSVTINAAGGGSFAITETEVNFGTNPVTDATFVVTDASITATSKIIATESGSIATGRIATGDSLWDTITYSCVPATGSFTLFARASGAVVGYRKLFYTYS